MATVHTQLEFLAQRALYEKEKPYCATYDQTDGIARGDLSNIEWAEHSVAIKSMRDNDCIALEKSGFGVYEHKSKFVPPSDRKAMEGYKLETEIHLRDMLKADFVLTYDIKIRYCGEYDDNEFVDITDVMSREGAPNGAHDLSFDYAPEQIRSRLGEDVYKQYCKPGYRFRVVNTWRSLLPKLEHRPLALCDARTVRPEVLVASDRAYPHKVIEMYYVHHEEQQEWYWCPDQTPEEVIVFATYDSQDKDARFCPHVSFHNTLAPPDAPPRESLETRSVVISRLAD